MKIINQEYQKIDIVPIHIELRNVIGKAIEVGHLKEELEETVQDMLENHKKWEQRIIDAREKYLFHFGKSSEVSGKYIIHRIKGENDKC